MKIVFVLEHYHPYIGGAERLFQLLAESLAARQHEVWVITTRFDEKLPSEESYHGVKIVRVNCKNRYLFSFLSLPTVIRFARRADILHTTTYNAALPAWIAGKLTGKKMVVTFHEVWGRLWFRLPFASRLSKLAYFLFEQLLIHLPFSHYIAVSKFTQKALLNAGIPDHRITQIYNGLHYGAYEKYSHQPPEKFTYLYFGRLGISKGLDLLLPAAKKFSERHPDSRCILILPKRPKAMYQNIIDLIDGLDLQKHVLIRHELSRSELLDQITHASCVVIPSYSEGFCFVAAETVALGVPVISSDQGALQETVSGRLIRMTELTELALTAALEKAFHNKWEFLPVRKFLMETALENYLQLYEGISKKPIHG